MRLIFLSEEFYNKYRDCPEILKKSTRPYVCLAIQIDGVQFAIPLRHHIHHKYAFITVADCGLDYTKAVIINGRTDIAPGHPQINQAEFNKLKGRDHVIENGMRKYIALYRKAKQYQNNLYYAWILKYSSLQYFEDYI